MIKIHNLTFKYKNSDNVLNDLNMEIHEGEIVAIVGENGSGKSTLGKLIAGLLKPKQGQIEIDNVDITSKKNNNVLNDVGIVFQNPENQIIFSNILDEVSFSLKNMSKEDLRKRIEESLEKVKMSEYKSRNLYELSLGQKQRIVIAEILAKRPKYIVLDEPTTMIDSTGKEEIREIIKKLKEDGYTIVYITNFSEELLLADRIFILENGQVAEEINRKELISKYDVLLKYNIKPPTLLEIAKKLNINLKDYNIDELVKQIEVKAK